MNAFDILLRELRKAASEAEHEVVIDEPANPDGKWFVALIGDDGFTVEVEWNRHLGFGLAAGRDLGFGSGVDEIYGSPEATAERIAELMAQRTATHDAPVPGLAELRKLRGMMQKDVAQRLGMSKGGLAQLEKGSSLEAMQVVTLRKLVASLGGELVLTAKFPEGRERQIACDPRLERS